MEQKEIEKEEPGKEENDYVESLPEFVRERIDEARDRDEDEGDNIVLLHGMEAAMVGTTERDGVVVAVYESGRCIECLAEGFRKDNPDRPDEENYADAEDWFSYNTVRAIPYMGKGAPIIIDGFGRDEEQWEAMRNG